MNQLRSAPTRIPNTLNSLTELVRRSMLQWSHRGCSVHTGWRNNDKQERE